MATSNLISKSLGDVLTESGTGTPDHTSPKGSLYSDTSTGTVYQNIDGSTSWVSLSTVAYGEVFYVGNTNATTVSALNVWYQVNNTFTEGENMGFSASTNTLVVKTGYDGVYRVEGNMTVVNVAGSNTFEGGISINSATPADGTYNGVSTTTTYTTSNITVSFETALVGGDVLSLAVRNTTGANNVIVRHGQIHAYKIR